MWFSIEILEFCNVIFMIEYDGERERFENSGSNQIN